MGIRTCGLDIKAGAKRDASDKAARAEAETVVQRWNDRLALCSLTCHDEIERRVVHQDMARFERMMRTPWRYQSSPQHQAAYRDAIERANAEPSPPEAPVAAPLDDEAAPATAAEPKPEAA
jgi:hypothetical protein